MGPVLLTEIDNFNLYLRYERRLSPHTVLAYLTDLQQMAAYLETTYGIRDCSAVTAIHLRSWLSELKGRGMGNRSLKRKIAALNTFFQYLMAQVKTAANPSGHLLLPKTDKPLPKFLSEKQTEGLIGEWPPDDDFEAWTQRLIIELLYQTGMRRAELIGLKGKDIDYSIGRLQVFGKGGKMRLIPLNGNLLKKLNHYIGLKNNKFVLPVENVLSLSSGKPLYPQYVYRTVKRYLSAVTTLDKKSPHVLRHTFASQLLNNGADLMAIKELLGHQSLAATQVYTHLNIERLKEVYEKAHPKAK
ncbi:MAG TPA: tyrosine-type recombinase/integrase [Edaphocola sp.]|nr:tyrosine-type recombinase/integrase [Edaphocola sp.]